MQMSGLLLKHGMKGCSISSRVCFLKLAYHFQGSMVSSGMPDHPEDRENLPVHRPAFDLLRQV